MGRSTFNWEQIKQMEHGHREHGIGHSVMALASRWQSLKDAMWYSRGNVYNRNTFGYVLEYTEKEGIKAKMKKEEYYEDNRFVKKKSTKKKKINNINKEEKIFTMIKKETNRKKIKSNQ